MTSSGFYPQGQRAANSGTGMLEKGQMLRACPCSQGGLRIAGDDGCDTTCTVPGTERVLSTGLSNERRKDYGWEAYVG